MSDLSRLPNHQDGLDMIDALDNIIASLEYEPPVDYSWSGATDENLATAIANLHAGTTTISELGWSVGDERTMSLSAIAAGSYNVAHAAQDVTLVIMDTNAYNGTGNLVWGLKDCLLETETMETSATNANGWHNSRGRKCCDAIWSMFPSWFRSSCLQFSVKSASQGGSDSASITSQSGYLALFAEKEIFGSKTNSVSTEANALTQIEYYKTSANRIKKVNGSANSWWERSPCYNFATAFCSVGANGTADTANAAHSFGFAPFGVI